MCEIAPRRYRRHSKFSHEFQYTKKARRRKKNTHQQNIIINKINGKRIRIVRIDCRPADERKIQNISEIGSLPCNAHTWETKNTNGGSVHIQQVSMRYLYSHTLAEICWSCETVTENGSLSIWWYTINAKDARRCAATQRSIAVQRTCACCIWCKSHASKWISIQCSSLHAHTDADHSHWDIVRMLSSLAIVPEKYTSELDVTHTDTDNAPNPISVFMVMCFFFSCSFYSLKIFLQNIQLDSRQQKRETKILFFNVGSSRFFFVSFYSSFIVHIRMVFGTAQHHFKSLTLVLTEITFVDVLYYVISSVVFFLSEEQFLASRQVHSVLALCECFI